MRGPGSTSKRTTRFDPRWALNAQGQPNQDAVDDFYYRATEVLTHMGKELTRSFYSAANETHADIHWARPESKSRVITIDQTRELMRDLFRALEEKKRLIELLEIIFIDGAARRHSVPTKPQQ